MWFFFKSGLLIPLFYFNIKLSPWFSFWLPKINICNGIMHILFYITVETSTPGSFVEIWQESRDVEFHKLLLSLILPPRLWFRALLSKNGENKEKLFLGTIRNDSFLLQWYMNSFRRWHAILDQDPRFLRGWLYEEIYST